MAIAKDAPHGNSSAQAPSAGIAWIESGGAVAICAILSVAPAIVSFLAAGDGGTAIVFESSVFGANYGRYLEELWKGHSLWMAGQYLTNGANYLPLYTLLYAIEGICGSSSAAYHLVLVVVQGVCLAATAALFRRWSMLAGAPQRTWKWVLPWFLALVYLSSLANFNYLKSTLLFALPCYSLPIQLYLADRYLADGRRPWLALLALAVLIMNSFNATFFAYVEGIVGTYLIWGSHLFALPGFARSAPAKALAFLLACAPAATLLLIAVVANIPYYGSLDELTAIMREGMYSLNANMVNILLLTTDWGLFGGFNGEAYYAFAPYYQRPAVQALGVSAMLVPTALLLFPTSMSRTARRLFAALGVTTLACAFIQLGMNNPVYSWLLENAFVFQVFRNITKLTPMLLLGVLGIFFFQLLSLRSDRVRSAALIAFGVASIGYSLPYWTYADYFLRDRSVSRIPAEWREAGKLIDGHANPGARVAMLPAIYVNDIYLWDGKKAWVQGSLADALWRTPTYRVSDGFVGPPMMQLGMKRLFVPSPDTPRGSTVDLPSLNAFLAREAFDFAVVNEDLLSEYGPVADIAPWLRRSGFSEIASLGPLRVFQNAANHRPMVSASVPFTYARLDNLTYRLRFPHVRGPLSVEFNEPFRPGWRLALDDLSGESACGEACERRGLLGYWEDIRLATRAAPFEGSHGIGSAGGNTWTLDPGAVASGEPSAFSRNADGSIDFSVTIHFAPQLFFVIASWIFVASLALVIAAFLHLPSVNRLKT